VYVIVSMVRFLYRVDGTVSSVSCVRSSLWCGFCPSRRVRDRLCGAVSLRVDVYGVERVVCAIVSMVQFLFE